MEGESSTYNQSRFECENMSMAVFFFANADCLWKGLTFVNENTALMPTKAEHSLPRLFCGYLTICFCSLNVR